VSPILHREVGPNWLRLQGGINIDGDNHEFSEEEPPDDDDNSRETKIKALSTILESLVEAEEESESIGDRNNYTKDTNVGNNNTGSISNRNSPSASSSSSCASSNATVRNPSADNIDVPTSNTVNDNIPTVPLPRSTRAPGTLLRDLTEWRCPYWGDLRGEDVDKNLAGMVSHTLGVASGIAGTERIYEGRLRELDLSANRLGPKTLAAIGDALRTRGDALLVARGETRTPHTSVSALLVAPLSTAPLFSAAVSTAPLSEASLPPASLPPASLPSASLPPAPCRLPLVLDLSSCKLEGKHMEILAKGLGEAFQAWKEGQKEGRKDDLQNLKEDEKGVTQGVPNQNEDEIATSANTVSNTTSVTIQNIDYLFSDTELDKIHLPSRLQLSDTKLKKNAFPSELIHNFNSPVAAMFEHGTFFFEELNLSENPQLGDVAGEELFEAIGGGAARGYESDEEDTRIGQKYAEERGESEFDIDPEEERMMLGKHHYPTKQRVTDHYHNALAHSAENTALRQMEMMYCGLSWRTAAVIGRLLAADTKGVERNESYSEEVYGKGANTGLPNSAESKENGLNDNGTHDGKDDGDSKPGASASADSADAVHGNSSGSGNNEKKKKPSTKNTLPPKIPPNWRCPLVYLDVSGNVGLGREGAKKRHGKTEGKNKKPNKIVLSDVWKRFSR
jgi:hypothetical protein